MERRLLAEAAIHGGAIFEFASDAICQAEGGMRTLLLVLLRAIGVVVVWLVGFFTTEWILR